jgi:hypothetical protein
MYFANISFVSFHRPDFQHFRLKQRYNEQLYFEASDGWFLSFLFNIKMVGRDQGSIVSKWFWEEKHKVS